MVQSNLQWIGGHGLHLIASLLPIGKAILAEGSKVIPFLSWSKCLFGDTFRKVPKLLLEPPWKVPKLSWVGLVALMMSVYSSGSSESPENM